MLHIGETPIAKESFTQRWFWNLVDEVVAKVLNVSQVRGLTGDLSKENFDSGNFWVPGQNICVAGESEGRISVGGVCQVTLSSGSLVQPECCPNQLIIVPIVGTMKSWKPVSFIIGSSSLSFSRTFNSSIEKKNDSKLKTIYWILVWSEKYSMLYWPVKSVWDGQSAFVCITKCEKLLCMSEQGCRIGLNKFQKQLY